MIIRAHSPVPTATFSLSFSETSERPPRRIRRTGEATHKRVLSAKDGAALALRSMNSEASSMLTRLRPGSELWTCGTWSSIESSSLSRKSVETEKMSLIRTILSISGTDWELSHFETDCLETPSCSASSSCDQPAFFLILMILSASIMLTPLSLMRGDLCAAAFCIRCLHGRLCCSCTLQTVHGSLSTAGCIFIFWS